MTDASPPRPDADPARLMQFLWIDTGEAHLATSIDLPPTSPPWPVVVLVHGLSGDRIGRSYHFVEFGRRLANRGIACVRFDHAGCGESTGDQLSLSMHAVERDALAVMDHVRRDGRFDAARLGVVGSSLGGLGGVMLAARCGARGLCLWAPVCDLPGMTRALAARTPLRETLEAIGYAPFKGLRLGPDYFQSLHHLDPGANLASYRGPVFIAHARDDQAVPISESHRYVQLCEERGVPCELLEFDGNTHDFHEEPARSKLLGESVGRLCRWLGVA